MIPQNFTELAVFTGRPAFAEPKHVGRPNIGDRARLRERLDDLLDRRWLTNDGPYVQELERRIAAWTATQHCVAVTSATVGLLLLCRALGLSGEVIVPSFTFVGTAGVLEWAGITPVFCDIDPRTHNIDPYAAERLIGPRTSGIVGVHVWGRACDIEALQSLAAAAKIRLLFDAAHAFGCTAGGRPIGQFGAAEVFSFHATKYVNSFEGGAITTNDSDLAESLRLMRNFGFSDYDHTEELGLNGKMSEPAAAMGLTSLDAEPHFRAINERNYHAFGQALSDLPGITFTQYDPGERNNYQYVVMEVDEPLAGLTRDELHAVLWAEQVRARRYFHPGCHMLEPFKTRYPQYAGALPATERLTGRVICLPNGESVSRDDVEVIASIIRTALRDAEAVRGVLSQREVLRA
ncbi:MAG TPA: aminotransferase class I/II-fold pyridoxal phosphate-dependent enzyme [Thermoanaerobaculia bacterium]|nr:aminotransferase class I/II-fold pyridoxal phosphate-dependent enzyme [Thermoanaerobaculia bacterium]